MRALFAAVVLTAAIPAGAGAATLTTDKADYAPGQVVHLHGSGFVPGQTYAMAVKRPDGSIVLINPLSHTVMPGAGWDTATALADGTFDHNYQLNGIEGAYVARAYPADWTGDWSLEPVAEAGFTDAFPAGNLDQCANGTLAAPEDCDVAVDWVNGALVESKAHYLEGESVPYRMRLANLEPGIEYAVTIEWDTLKGGKHAIDYLTSYDRTVTTADPCAGVPSCSAGTFDSAPIAQQADVTGAGITPAPGVFTLFGGTITSVDPYVYDTSGDKPVSVMVHFTSTVSDPVLAWGGHIASRQDWGAGESAVSISGSPYHMRFLGFGDEQMGGNQDRALSAGAVIFPASITIVKDATPNGATSFAFSASPAPLTGFSLVDDATSANTRAFTAITSFTSYTVTEGAASGWSLDSITCTDVDLGTADDATTTSLLSRTATIGLAEGENVRCTFVNTRQPGSLTVVKDLVPSSDSGRFDLKIEDDVVANDVGDNGSGNRVLDAGVYTVSETGAPDSVTNAATDLDAYSPSVDCRDATGASVASNATGSTVDVTVDPAGAITCTITNVRKATLTVVKQASPASAQSFTINGGGTGVPASFGLVDDDAGPGDGDEQFTFSSGQFGAKTLSEVVPAGWSLESATCTGASDTNAGAGISVAIGAGDAVVCTFVNNKDASLTVVKQASPASAQSFTISGGGTGVPASFGLVDDNAGPGDDDEQFAFSSGEFGTKTLSEAVPAGWSLESATCTGATDTNAGAAISVAIGAGDAVVCTFVNNKDASLTVVKQAAPASAQSFTINGGGTGVPASFGMVDDDAGPGDDDEQFTFSSGQFGTKTLSEAVPAGWSLESATCTGATDTNAGAAISVAIGAGDAVVCTFVNNKDASLTVVKQAAPASAQSFTINGGGTGVPASFGMVDDDAGPGDDDEQFTFSSGQFGTKTLSEAVPAGWSLESATCTGATDTNAGAAISVAIGAGDAVVCTFVNNKDASLTVVKQAAPASAQSFTINGGGTGVPASFGMVDDDAGPGDDDEQFTFSSGQFGTKTLSEAVPSGWSLESATCTGATDTDAGAGVSVAISPGDAVTCTFVNNKDASLTVVKQAAPASGQSFTINGGGTGVPSSFGLVDDDAGPGDDDVQFTFSSGQFGTKTLSEAVPAGWSLESATCTGATDTNAGGGISVAIGAGDAVVCTFVNNKDASLTVVKQAAPASAQSFTISGGGTGVPASFGLVDDDAGPGDGDEQFTFSSGQFGTKTLSEAVPPGWSLESATCTGATDTNAGAAISVAVGAGDAVVCTFVNNRDASLTVVKQAAPASSQSFTITGGGVGVPASFGLVDDDAGPGDDDEQLTFATGQFGTKTLSEVVPAGWSLESATCTGATDTDAGAGVSVAISPGDAVTCTFVNNKDASLRVIKQAAPASAQSFTINGGGTGVPASFGLVDDDAGPGDDDEQFTFSTGQFGAKTLSEVVPAGWSLASATCAGATDTNAGAGISVAIGAGDSVVCTFVNNKDATLTVIKQASPASAQSFTINGGGTGVPASFGLVDDNAGPGDDDEQFTFATGQFGTKTLSEAVPAGWSLESATCTGATDTNAGAAISVALNAGDAVTCTFVDNKDATLTVVKQASPASAQSFTINAGGTGVPASFGLVDDDAGPGDDDEQFTLSSGEFGAKTLAEAVPAGWKLTSATCTGATDTDAGAPISVAIGAGDAVRCTFVNVKDTTLTVIKHVVNKGGSRAQAGDFQMDVTATSPGDAHFPGTEDGKTILVDPGAYAVDESGGPTTFAKELSDDCSGRIAVGEHRTCTITNTKVLPGGVVVKRGATYAYHGDGLSFTFEVTNPGTTPLTTVTVTDDKCAPVTGPTEKLGGDQDGLLEAGEAWLYTCTMAVPAHTAGDTSLANTVTLAATDADGEPVADTDAHTTQILHPAIDIDKTGPATAQAGQAVGYALVVTNPGDVAFLAANVNVGDARCEAPPALITKNGDATPDRLDPGDRWSYVCRVRTLVGQTVVQNVGVVAATDSFGGREVTDSDPATTALTQPPQPPAEITPSDVPAATPAGTARLSGPPRCVAKAFKVSVRGREIAQVAFFVDGRRKLTVKRKPGRTVFAMTINPRGQSQKLHRVVARITFTAASKTRGRTLRLVYKRCARAAVRPQYTG